MAVCRVDTFDCSDGDERLDEFPRARLGRGRETRREERQQSHGAEKSPPGPMERRAPNGRRCRRIGWCQIRPGRIHWFGFLMLLLLCLFPDG